MGFFKPDMPKAVAEPPQQVDTRDASADAADAAARRAGARRSSTDTDLTGPARSRGGLAQALRKTIGG